MHFDKKIAERLRSARIKSGYPSAKLFAKANNLPYVTYSQYETGKRRISSESILRFANLLNISPSWLLTGHTDSSSTINQENLYSSQQLNHTSINADFLADVFEAVNQMICVSDSKLSDRDKIILTAELYSALNNNADIITKKNNLKALINAIKKIKSGIVDKIA